MVGVTSQGSEQEKSAEVRIKPGQQQDRNRSRSRMQDAGYRAQEKHNTKAESSGLNVP
ncbi:unnamed protein product [Staurois parvus]|uniref:Uncharacterized protein n=1 Tax=Staurois parvus TaxID=386267 RepID=A0ABN9FQZ4_9NEOB|nr:unnamed protein product [Staurois parvus]